MKKFKYTHCTKCGCELNEENRFLQYSHKGTNREKVASSQLCIKHRMEMTYECRKIDRDKKGKKPTLKVKENRKFCSVETCKAPLTEENTKFLKYYTKDGGLLFSQVGKCKSCLCTYQNEKRTSKRKYTKKKKEIIEEIIVKKEIIEEIIEEKEIIEEIIEEKKLTTKEKMQIIFDEQEKRRIETKTKGLDSKMVNPLFRMGDEE